MGDLQGALAVHFNFPLLSFSQLSKLGLPLPVSLFLWNRGGLVNGAVYIVKCTVYSVQCTVNSVKYIVNSVHCCVLSTVCSEQSTV